MPNPIQTERDEPLTPAQVEVVTQMIEDRQAALLNEVNRLINSAVENSVLYGDTVALRVNSGKLISVKEGGPTGDDQPINLVSRTDAGPWELLNVERG